jgi:two-component system response regulator DesR
MPAQTEVIRVFIADDDARLVKELTEHINATSNSNIKVTGSVTDGKELWDKAENLSKEADVVIVDIGMPGMDGLTAAGRIKSQNGGKVKVLVITGLRGRNYPAEAIRHHADGFVAKIRGIGDIVDAIKRLHKGEIVYLPDPSDPAHPPELPPPPPELTPIEKRILCMILDGKAAKEIAAELNKGQPLIEKFWRNIASKLGTTKVAVMVRLAVEYGLCNDDEKAQ